MLGLGTHMYAASAFFSKEGLKERVPGPDGKEMDSGDLIEEADGFAGAGDAGQRGDCFSYLAHKAMFIVASVKVEYT